MRQQIIKLNFIPYTILYFSLLLISEGQHAVLASTLWPIKWVVLQLSYTTTTMAEPPNHQVPVRVRPPRRSWVWQYFDQELVHQAGEEVIKARCKWPGCTLHLFAGRGGGPIGHLQRHRDAYIRRSQVQDGEGSGVDES